MAIQRHFFGLVGGVRRGAVGVAAVLTMLTLPIATSSASSKACTSGVGIKITNPVVCKGLAFYKGSTITWIAGVAGGSSDVTARAAAPLIGEYLGATVNVSDQGQANGIPGQDGLAAAAPNGLEIGFTNAGSIASLVLTKQTGFNFNLSRLSYILGETGTPAVLVSNSTSGYSSFAALRAATTTSSSVKLVTSFPGASASGLEILLNLLGMHVTWVTGYTSPAAVATGFYRGDGPVADGAFAYFEGLIQGRSATSVATSVGLPPGAALRGLLVNTPTYASLLKTYAPKNPTKAWKTAAAAEVLFAKLGQPLVTQTKVAGYKLDALRAAAQWAWAQQSFVSANLAIANPPTYVNPVMAKTEFNTIIKDGPALSKYLPETTP